MLSILLVYVYMYECTDLVCSDLVWLLSYTCLIKEGEEEEEEDDEQCGKLHRLI